MGERDLTGLFPCRGKEKGIMTEKNQLCSVGKILVVKYEERKQINNQILGAYRVNKELFKI